MNDGVELPEDLAQLGVEVVLDAVVSPKGRLWLTCLGFGQRSMTTYCRFRCATPLVFATIRWSTRPSWLPRKCGSHI